MRTLGFHVVLWWPVLQRITVAVSSWSVPSGLCLTQVPGISTLYHHHSFHRFRRKLLLLTNSVITNSDKLLVWRWPCFSFLFISSGVSSQQLMVLMGQVLSRNLSSSFESAPGKMLNVIWPYLSRKEDVDSYLQCIDAWMPYLLRHWRVNLECQMTCQLDMICSHGWFTFRSKRSTGLSTISSAISGRKPKPITFLCWIVSFKR